MSSYFLLEANSFTNLCCHYSENSRAMFLGKDYKNKAAMIESQKQYPTNALFEYSGKEKHILLIERFNDQDNTLHQSFLLDQQFSVIMNKKKQIANFNTMARKKMAGDEICYQIKDEEPWYFYKGFYSKYSTLNDFIVGRQHWQRSENALKISSDSISRKHCRLACNQPTELKKRGFALSLRQMIKQSSKMTSKWRKVPFLLLETIAEYLIQKPYYSVQDCLSRNGTFLLDRLVEKTPIKLGQQYQFESHKESIKPQKILRASGAQISAIIDEFAAKWKEPSTKYYQKYDFIFSPEASKQSIQKSDQQYNAILLVIFVSYQCKFHYWIICKTGNHSYSLGFGQTLNLSPNQYVDQHYRYQNQRHGYIEYRERKWWIFAAEEQERVWVKIQPQKPYALDTKKTYFLRIGRLSTLQLQFRHF